MPSSSMVLFKIDEDLYKLDRDLYKIDWIFDSVFKMEADGCLSFCCRI